MFAPLFDALIEDYHGGYKVILLEHTQGTHALQPTDKHTSDMDVSKIHGAIDPKGQYVNSTRIRVGRNIRGLGLSPGISRAQRREVGGMGASDSMSHCRCGGLQRACDLI